MVSSGKLNQILPVMDWTPPSICNYMQADANTRKKGRPKKLAVTLDDRYPALSQTESSSEEEKSACLWSSS